MAKVEIDFSPRFVRLQWGRRARPQCLQPRQYGGNNLEGVYCVEVHPGLETCSIPISTGYQILILDTGYHKLSIPTGY